MQIRLKRDWFGPDGVRYRAKDRTGSLYIQVIPDELFADLPSQTEVWLDGEKLGTAEDIRNGTVELPAKAVDPAEVKRAQAITEAEAELDSAKKTLKTTEDVLFAERTDAHIKAVAEAKRVVAAAQVNVQKAKSAEVPKAKAKE